MGDQPDKKAKDKHFSWTDPIERLPANHYKKLGYKDEEKQKVKA